jgi:hypothetical protein
MDIIQSAEDYFVFLLGLGLAPVLYTVLMLSVFIGLLVMDFAGFQGKLSEAPETRLSFSAIRAG